MLTNYLRHRRHEAGRGVEETMTDIDYTLALLACLPFVVAVVGWIWPTREPQTPARRR